jgi:hypothetical protein
LSESVIEPLSDLTAGKGPEKCIDAVGMESHVGIIRDNVRRDRDHVARYGGEEFLCFFQ